MKYFFHKLAIFDILAEPVIVNPCIPNPCGSNADCSVNGDRYICKCIGEYIGNPYVSCRPECVVNSECRRNQACTNQKCGDPCPGTCGNNALCEVINHNAICSCPLGYEGDPFEGCRRIPGIYYWKTLTLLPKSLCKKWLHLVSYSRDNGRKQ